MSGFDYFKKCMTTHFANFDGRARRKEYWYFTLFNFILLMVGTVIHPILYIIIALATLIPNIAVMIRRMHDVGKSGWFCLIPIYNLILALTNGEQNTNEYGPDPKNPDSGDVIEHLVG